MNCDKARELIPFLDDGSIEAETADELREHLRDCPACRIEYKETMNMLERVRKVLVENQPAPGPGYLDMVQENVGRKKKARVFYYRAVSAVAVIVFTVSLSIYSFLVKFKTEPVTEQYVMGEVLEGFDNYITSQSFTGYDLNELVDVIEVIDEESIVTDLLAYSYANFTTEDVIELMDDSEIAELFVTPER